MSRLRCIPILQKINRRRSRVSHLTHTIGIASPASKFTSIHGFGSSIRESQNYSNSASQPLPSPSLEIPQDVLVDEEKILGYKHDHFYPAHPGDILNEQYTLVAKVGWGSSSTVWLAQDNERQVREWLSGNSLFRQPGIQQYTAIQHLADMIGLIGPVPPTIVRREKEMRHRRWLPEIRNPQNKICDNAADYYGGPFFDNDGSFVGREFVPARRSLTQELPERIQEERRTELFMDFMRKILCWVPEQRATAAQLLNDPWLLSD